MKYIIKERKSNNIITKQSNTFLSFLYNTLLGRIILKLFISKPFSKIIGLYLNSKLSTIRIKRFIKNNDINIKEYENKKYTSFNDFFIRKIKEENRPLNKNKNIFISPCDSKLTVYKINKDLTVKIKDSYYTIDTLVNKDIMNEYINGYMLVFRLEPTDYHRYCYIDNGNHDKNIHINGVLHTVQMISLNKYNFYKTNDREYTILHTENYSDVVHIEIGAMIVGKIHNLHENYNFKKGEEKGYFEFGGSTICLLVKPNIINIDKDILENSKNNIETIVHYREKIATKKEN